MNKFIMLVGIPGAGKSTFGKTLIDPNTIYLSSDELREEFYGDASIQTNPSLIFNEMQRRTLSALKEGKSVIYDATNLNRKKRIGFLKQLPQNVEKICYIVWAKIETCINRDSMRNRVVGEAVILNILRKFETPYLDEGFDSIKIFNTDFSYYKLEDFKSLLSIPHDNPHHPGLIIEHINRVICETEKYNDLILVDVAKCHDLGKCYTKSFLNSKNEITDIAHYYNHQNVSAYITLGIEDLSSNNLLVSWLVNLHMEPFFNESNYMKNLNIKWKEFLYTFNSCDILGA